MNDVISIVVPIYNVEKELPKCIESIIGQTYTYLEIILVNDGSPDNCALICEEYADKDSRIILINKKNGGLSDARNAGLRKATGKYVMYVDSDDYLELTACEQLLYGMKYEDVDFVVGAIKENRNESIVYQKHTCVMPGKKYDAKNFIIASIKANEWYAPVVLNLYRRDFLIANNLYFKVGQYYEDMDMLPRIYLRAKNIVYIDYDFYNYVIRDNSIMKSSISPKKTVDAINNYICWKKYFDQIEDKELQKHLYGIMIKCYLKSCRNHKVTKWKIPGCGIEFALKYSLNKKECIKAVFFNTFPKLYIRMK